MKWRKIIWKIQKVWRSGISYLWIFDHQSSHIMSPTAIARVRWTTTRVHLAAISVSVFTLTSAFSFSGHLFSWLYLVWIWKESFEMKVYVCFHHVKVLVLKVSLEIWESNCFCTREREKRSFAFHVFFSFNFWRRRITWERESDVFILVLFSFISPRVS